MEDIYTGIHKLLPCACRYPGYGFLFAIVVRFSSLLQTANAFFNWNYKTNWIYGKVNGWSAFSYDQPTHRLTVKACSVMPAPYNDECTQVKMESLFIFCLIRYWKVPHKGVSYWSRLLSSTVSPWSRISLRKKMLMLSAPRLVFGGKGFQQEFLFDVYILFY